MGPAKTLCNTGFFESGLKWTVARKWTVHPKVDGPNESKLDRPLLVFWTIQFYS